VAILVLAVVPTAPASASQLTDKRAEAVRVQAQIGALNTKVEIAAEAYNAAGDKLGRIDASIKANNAKLVQLEHRLGTVDKRLDTRATNMYQDGPLGYLEVLFGSTSFDEFASRWDLMTQMSQSDASLISSVKSLKARSQATKTQLRSDHVAASAQLRLRQQQKVAIAGQLAQRRTVLASVDSEIKTIVAQQAAAAAAAAAAASRARAEQLAAATGSGDSGTSGSGGGGSGGSSFPAPSIPAHGNVVDYARSRLGLPYVWAAAGPDSFDCSGLVLWCYAKIGISLPHSSQEQINCGQRVSQKDLQPGDLVFFGSPIHHVGMYIGGGQMIEAPHTGANVRISGAFRSDYAGACRP
jgi:cell wall-associated NlpC family hydrolase